MRYIFMLAGGLVVACLAVWAIIAVCVWLIWNMGMLFAILLVVGVGFVLGVYGDKATDAEIRAKYGDY